MVLWGFGNSADRAKDDQHSQVRVQSQPQFRAPPPATPSPTCNSPPCSSHALNSRLASSLARHVEERNLNSNRRVGCISLTALKRGREEGRGRWWQKEGVGGKKRMNTGDQLIARRSWLRIECLNHGYISPRQMAPLVRGTLWKKNGRTSARIYGCVTVRGSS